jgi:hypothetical protein
MGTHLHYSHDGEWITSHDVAQDVFASIVKDVRFHVLHEHIRVLLLPSFQFFHWWVDIVLLANGICTLADMVIVNPT